MDIKHLQYFVVSVDMGSFHSAAKVLFTTQSHISKTIKALETELNMVLLERKRNGVVITKEGQKIYQYAVNILKEMQNITDTRDNQGSQRFSVATVPSNNLAWLVSQYYNQSKDKNLQIDFWEGNVEDVIARVHRRKAELGFVYISERHFSAFQNQVNAKALYFEELSRTGLYLYVGNNHPLFNEYNVDEHMIQKMKLIRHYEEHYSLINHLGHIKEDAPLKNETLLMSSTTNSDHFMLQMLYNTDYCYLGGDFYKGKVLENKIKGIPISTENEKIIYGYLKRKNNELTVSSNEFLDFLKQRIQKNED